MHECRGDAPNCSGEHRQNGGECLPWTTQLRERMKETTRQTSLRCSRTPYLPPPPSSPPFAKRITNGERTKKIWENYFCPKAVNAAVLPAPRCPLGAIPGTGWLLEWLGLVERLWPPAWRLRQQWQAPSLPGKWLTAAAEGILKCLRVRKERKRELPVSAPCF